MGQKRNISIRVNVLPESAGEWMEQIANRTIIDPDIIVEKTVIKELTSPFL